MPPLESSPLGTVRLGALTTAALLSVVLMTVHVAQDALYSSAGVGLRGWAVVAAVVFVILLGTFGVLGRRAGYVIILLGGALELVIVWLHGLGPASMKWGVVFVATLVALSVCGVSAVMLSAHALWHDVRK